MIPPVRATEQGTAQAGNPGAFASVRNCSIMIGFPLKKESMRGGGHKCSDGDAAPQILRVESHTKEGESPVDRSAVHLRRRYLPPPLESGYFGV